MSNGFMVMEMQGGGVGSETTKGIPMSLAATIFLILLLIIFYKYLCAVAL